MITSCFHQICSGVIWKFYTFSRRQLRGQDLGQTTHRCTPRYVRPAVHAVTSHSSWNSCCCHLHLHFQVINRHTLTRLNFFFSQKVTRNVCFSTRQAPGVITGVMILTRYMLDPRHVSRLVRGQHGTAAVRLISCKWRSNQTNGAGRAIFCKTVSTADNWILTRKYEHIDKWITINLI
jgi:hypothetical protein